jgi:acetyl esterase/lipase
MIAILFFTLALLTALSTYLALCTPRRPLVVGWLSWVIGLVPCEIPSAALLANVLLAILSAVLGSPESTLGIVTTALFVAAILGDVVLVRRCRLARAAVRQSLHAALGERFERAVDASLAPTDERPVSALREAFAPFRARRRDVVHVADIAYGDVDERNRLDLYFHESRPRGCPVLVYVHGGAWTHGKKDQQGLPIVYHFASRGWLCVQPGYRLCPDATFPDQIVDVKRAIAWVHRHAAEHGGDASQVFVAGGSAGGHLSAMAALTINDPVFQPGFEEADTSVVAAMPLYGDYDWLDTSDERARRGLDRSTYFAERILKCSADGDRARWEQGSPLYHVHGGAPPFFVVHGERDTMLLVEDARHFAEALHSVSRSPVAYAELPGAQHAFDGFQSVRCGSVINGMEWFAAWVRTARLQAV